MSKFNIKWKSILFVIILIFGFLLIYYDFNVIGADFRTIFRHLIIVSGIYFIIDASLTWFYIYSLKKSQTTAPRRSYIFPFPLFGSYLDVLPYSISLTTLFYGVLFLFGLLLYPPSSLVLSFGGRVAAIFLLIGDLTLIGERMRKLFSETLIEVVKS